VSLLHCLSDWLSPGDEPDVGGVDTKFLLEHANRYKYMTVDTDQSGDWCRCNLCGRRFELEAFPQLVEHVSDHGDQVTDAVDPFDEAEEPTVITEEMLTEVAEWRAENVDEVEA
jgi:transcription elongation factor Elf1